MKTICLFAFFFNVCWTAWPIAVKQYLIIGKSSFYLLWKLYFHILHFSAFVFWASNLPGWSQCSPTRTLKSTAPAHGIQMVALWAVGLNYTTIFFCRINLFYSLLSLLCCATFVLITLFQLSQESSGKQEAPMLAGQRHLCFIGCSFPWCITLKLNK